MKKSPFIIVFVMALMICFTISVFGDFYAIPSSNKNCQTPIGSIVAWNKSMTGVPSLPDGWIECNGQSISDAGSPMNGQTVPDLNGSSETQRFLRGATSSGGTGGSETHSHTGTTSQQTFTGGTENHTQSGNQSINHTHTFTTSEESTLPSYYEVVWIIRIK